jgi:thioredoxin reductase (NADPH)
MVSADEIGAVELFASLGAVARERIADAAADIRVSPGEFAIHAGDERALYVMLEGRLETVKHEDGIERIVGGRAAGDLIGEVPIVLGTAFPFGFRAVEESRLIRVDAQTYHQVAAAEPRLAVALGEIAQRRIGGLQGITADQPPPRALVLGERWDESCSRIRRFLDRNQVTHRWITPDAPDAADAWGRALPDAQDLPIVRVLGERTIMRPEPRRLAELLGLSTEPAAAEYDTLIIGAGPAGLAAAVYGASEGLRTIVVEREAPGGQAGSSSRIENYLGFSSGVSGGELASRALLQARRLGAEILVTRSITRIDAVRRQVYLDGGDVIPARTIVLACGVTWRRLSIAGCDRLVGRGVSYGAARSEAANTHGLDVHIVGAGNSAGQAALFFATHARSVTILCRSHALEKSMSQYLIEQLARRSNVRVMTRAQLGGVHGTESVEAIDVVDADTGETTRHASGGVFVFIGADAETDWLPAEIARDARGYVLTGPDIPEGAWTGNGRDPFLLETSVPGVFACGDVRLSPVKRVAAAVGEGSMAIAFVHQYLRAAARA